jgi:hypothetical protein
LGRVEGGDRAVEGRHVADVRPQPSVAHALGDLDELGTIGLDDEVDRQAVGRPRLAKNGTVSPQSSARALARSRCRPSSTTVVGSSEIRRTAGLFVPFSRALRTDHQAPADCQGPQVGVNP